MKTYLSFARLVFVLALIATIIGFTAFSQLPAEKSPVQKERSTKSDSSTGKGQKNEESGRLEQITIDLKQLDLKLDRLTEELRHDDVRESQKELKRAMKELKSNRLSTEIDRSFKNVDWNRVSSEIHERIATLDSVDVNDIKKELERVKATVRINQSELHYRMPEIDTRKIRLQAFDAMKNARKSITGATAAVRNLQEFTNVLEHDGLIDQSKPFKIEVKGGNLYINGNKQSKKVSDRYKRFYKKDSFTIDINTENDTWI